MYAFIKLLEVLFFGGVIIAVIYNCWDVTPKKKKGKKIWD
jgi:hypothetical protein